MVGGKDLEGLTNWALGRGGEWLELGPGGARCAGEGI
jgi:hypothetical protein